MTKKMVSKRLDITMDPETYKKLKDIIATGKIGRTKSGVLSALVNQYNKK